MPSKRVLVTGGAGFIGSHVCEAYLADGWEVTALDDLSTGKRDNVPNGVDLVVADVRSEEVERLCAERRFHLINHHAAQIDVRVSVQNPRLDASINVDGLLNLLECALATGVERFVAVSSGGVVYGEPESLPVSEEAPKLPLSPYGVSKLTGEHYLYYYRKIHGLRSVTLRYSNVFGPRQDPHGEAGVVAIFASRLLEGAPLTVYGDGEQTRDYVYVEDVAQASIVCSHLELADPAGLDDVAFNVGTSTETTVNQLATSLMAIAGREVALKYAAERPGELRRSSLDAGRLRQRGWCPRFDLTAGLARTYAYIAEHGA